MTAEVLRSVLVIAGAMLLAGAGIGAGGMWAWLHRDGDVASIRRAVRGRAAHRRIQRMARPS